MGVDEQQPAREVQRRHVDRFAGGVDRGGRIGQHRFRAALLQALAGLWGRQRGVGHDPSVGRGGWGRASVELRVSWIARREGDGGALPQQNLPPQQLRLDGEGIGR